MAWLSLKMCRIFARLAANPGVEAAGLVAFRVNLAVRIAGIVFLVVFAPPFFSTGGTELFEDVIEKSVPLDPTGSFSLKATDGIVQIYGADITEVKIMATRRAFSLSRLNAMQVRLEGAAGKVDCLTTIAAKPTGAWRDASGTVDYVIEVPQTTSFVSVEVPNGELVLHGLRGQRLSAVLGNGRLTVRNCFCDQNVRVGSGGLDLVFDWVEEHPLTIDARIDDGNARALIPADAAFHVRARAETGHVASDFTEMKDRKSRVGGDQLDEHFGSGPESALELLARKGNIHLTEVVW